ncbi:hypothetical protein ACJX0J_036674, partial [Zea mays]
IFSLFIVRSLEQFRTNIPWLGFWKIAHIWFKISILSDCGICTCLQHPLSMWRCIT